MEAQPSGLTRLSFCCAAQKDHIILGTDNYFRSSQTKWDQHIGERPPRTRGVPGVSLNTVNFVCILSFHDCHRHRCSSSAASVSRFNQCPSTANQHPHHSTILPKVACKADAYRLLWLTLLLQGFCRDSKLFVCVRSSYMQASCLYSIHKWCLANMPA